MTVGELGEQPIWVCNATNVDPIVWLVNWELGFVRIWCFPARLGGVKDSSDMRGESCEWRKWVRMRSINGERVFIVANCPNID